MGYNSENLTKLKQLTEEIVSKEMLEAEERRCIISALEKICSMLEKPKINKKIIRGEIESLMTKLTNS
jgi:hypothetical protein